MPSKFSMSCRRSRRTISLPNEVLHQMFSNLSPSLLTVLARVSRRFNAVAEHILYSSIFIKDILSESSPYPWRTKNCCESIIRRTHLIESMRGLHIKWQPDAQSPSVHFDFAPTAMMLAQALRVLSSGPLESLELWLGPANRPAADSQTPHVVERIIHGSHFPHLIYCSLGAEWSKGSPFYSGILNTFVASLHLLRHLKLPDHYAALNLPPDALPVLSAFRGSPVASASLLPGRPIQYLSLVGPDDDVNQENLYRFAHTTVPLRLLDLSAMSVRTVLLRNLAQYLPTIESLKIKLALRHTLHYALSGIRILAGLSSVLSTFHQLAHLDLSPTSVAGADAEQELGLCNEWSRACPSLRTIIFPSHTKWALASDGSWLPYV